MRFPHRANAYFALVLMCVAADMCMAAGAQNSGSPQRPLHTLLTAREAHSLPLEEAARAYPVHLRAVVTYYDPYIDPRHGALFVHDDTGSIFAALPSRPILPLRAGDIVDLQAVTGTGDYAPILARAQVRVIGHSHLPEKAQTATMMELLSGALDGQWVEIEGVVHSVHLTPGNITLDIATSLGSISSTTLRVNGVDYDALIDSLVRVHGNAAPVFNRKLQMVGTRLFFPSLQELSVLQAAAADPYSTPAHSISSLLRYSPGLGLARRVHMQGRVTLQWPGRMLCIQQQSDGLCMQTAEATPVSAGDLVDVLGFPAISEFKPTLGDATYRRAGGSAMRLSVKAVSATEALQGDHDGELIQIEGELVGQDRATGDLTLMLRSGTLPFPAILPAGLMPSETLPWKEGSTLRLTGICSVQFDSERTYAGPGNISAGKVRIFVRSVGDVDVLRAPTWWTPAHTLEILVAVAAIVFMSFAWIIILRRRVRQQTKALRDSEERLRHLSEHDALTNLPNRILLNDRMTMALQRAVRFQEGIGLLMVDVDRFKEVNDTYGHPVGDKLLCELAKRISHSVRLTDTVARIGGDEFIILLPDLHSQEEAQSIAAKVVATVSAPFNIGPGQHPIPVTVSVGICTYPEAGSTIEILLQHVDAAMYCVKAHGRNGFQIYRPEDCDTK
jgi:diguanylate cyclase (GGDEF)-like protein